MGKTKDSPKRTREERAFEERRRATYDTCANCGQRVSTRGPKPKSGKRYCAHPACVKVRNHQDYLARTGRRVEPEKKQAPDVCANCQAALKPRPWRSGDEFGRWCPRPACRAHRHERREAILTKEASEALDLVDHLKTVTAFLSEVIMADNPDHPDSRVTCPDCGLTSAVKRWPHPADPEATRSCLGTLEGVEPRRIGPSGLIGAWPAPRTYVTPQEES